MNINQVADDDLSSCFYLGRRKVKSIMSKKKSIMWYADARNFGYEQETFYTKDQMIEAYLEGYLAGSPSQLRNDSVDHLLKESMEAMEYVDSLEVGK